MKFNKMLNNIKKKLLNERKEIPKDVMKIAPEITVDKNGKVIINSKELKEMLKEESFSFDPIESAAAGNIIINVYCPKPKHKELELEDPFTQPLVDLPIDGPLRKRKK